MTPAVLVPLVIAAAVVVIVAVVWVRRPTDTVDSFRRQIDALSPEARRGVVDQVQSVSPRPIKASPPVSDTTSDQVGGDGDGDSDADTTTGAGPDGGAATDATGGRVLRVEPAAHDSPTVEVVDARGAAASDADDADADVDADADADADADGADVDAAADAAEVSAAMETDATVDDTLDDAVDDGAATDLDTGEALADAADGTSDDEDGDRGP